MGMTFPRTIQQGVVAVLALLVLKA